MKTLFAIMMVLVVLPLPGAQAHEVRPAYLELTEMGNGNIRVVWKQPILGEVAIRLQPSVRGGWLNDTAATVAYSETHLLKVWEVKGPRSLQGEVITIVGLEKSITDVLLKVNLRNGGVITTLLKPSMPRYVIDVERTSEIAVSQYLRLGIEHILLGIDHLIFVLGLVLLVGYGRKLFFTITAFTVAHSITLALATLGVVHVQPGPVEAVIALSIVFLAVELVNHERGEEVFTRRYPWVVAFCFGLLHGFGFAGALNEVGLPTSDIPSALFLFNVGVEIGQFIFVAAMLSVVALFKKWLPHYRLKGKWIVSYAIGSVAAYWFIERLSLAVFDISPQYLIQSLTYLP